MKPERWQQIDELLQSALARSPEERSAFLARACNEDELLRSEVESLIASHEDASNFLETPMSQIAAELLVNGRPGLIAGRRIGPYKIMRLLGVGGMGEVYLAEDPRLGRKIALKLLPDYLTKDTDRLRRFEQEARAASSLNHPNIVTIYEIGKADGHHFIASEFIDGVTLREHMTAPRIVPDGSPSTAMKLGEILDLAVQIGEALTAAHAAGIVHRDIKPENIMVRHDAYLKVLDFGLAKLTERPTFAIDAEGTTQALLKTNPGIVMGTVTYMSPEQARGVPVDARTDIWSFGVVLYEMVAGRVPFEGETATDVILSIVEKHAPPLVRYSKEMPPEFERIVSKALRKNKAERYQTAKDLALDLKNLNQELEVQARLERSIQSGAGRGESAETGSEQMATVTGPQSAARAAGVGTIQPISSAEYIVSRVKTHKLSLILAIGALVLVAITYATFFRRTPTSQPQIKSLAVLPLKSLSKDANDYELGLGLAADIITRVSQNSELIVRPTSAVKAFASRDVNSLDAARQLNVDSVLDGTVQRVGDRLHINLNLLSAQDGVSMWSDSFNVSPSDVLKMQDEVAQQVAARLRLKLRPQRQISSVNPQAYDLYLRAKYHAGLENEPESEVAIALFERAVQTDPNFAAAYAELASEYERRAFSLKPQEREWEEKAYAATETALSLDPDLAEAHIARGLLLWTRSNHFPHERAIQEFRRALELNPNSDEAHHQLAYIYNHIGLLDKGQEEIQKAVAINPSNTAARFRVAVNLLYQRKYEQALAAFGDSEKYNPSLWAYMTAWALFQLGRKDEAAARIAEYLKRYPSDEGGSLTSMEAVLAASAGDERKAEEKIKRAAEIGKDYGHFHHTAYAIASAYALMNKRAQAIEWLQNAAEDGFPCYSLFEGDPNLNNLRQDTRFITFMAKLKEQWERYNASL